MRGKFKDILQLHNFPFDIQVLNVAFEFRLNRVRVSNEKISEEATEQNIRSADPINPDEEGPIELGAVRPTLPHDADENVHDDSGSSFRQTTAKRGGHSEVQGHLIPMSGVPGVYQREKELAQDPKQDGSDFVKTASWSSVEPKENILDEYAMFSPSLVCLARRADYRMRCFSVGLSPAVWGDPVLSITVVYYVRGFVRS